MKKTITCISLFLLTFTFVIGIFSAEKVSAADSIDEKKLLDGDNGTNSGSAYPYLETAPPVVLDSFFLHQASITRRTTPFNPYLVNPIILEDNFNECGVQKVVYDLFKIDGLGNPVEVNEEPILDPVTHIASYKIKRRVKMCVEGSPYNEFRTCRTDRDCGGDGKKDIYCQRTAKEKKITRINVTNDEFGTFMYDSLRPETLLVPSSKDLGNPPNPPIPDNHNVDHYKCYKVKPTRGMPRLQPTQVLVSDQPANAKVYTVTKPRWLCAPVSKDGEPIKDDKTHLMCYDVKLEKNICAAGSPINEFEPCRRDLECGGDNYCKRQYYSKPVKSVYVNNQFNQPLDLTVKRENLLCIPSTKEIKFNRCN